MTQPSNVHSIEDITSALEAPAKRVVYTFDVPKAIAQLTGVKTVGIVELTPQEMMTAQARGGASNIGTGFELAKECWRRLDGKPIHTGDGTADVAWSKDAPGWSKLRSLIAQAYQDVHNPAKEEADTFLASRSVKLG